VRTNIAHFGGDAHRIILAGQSAGGVSADYWAYAYAHDPIVSGLILVSGTAFSFPLNAPDIPARNWNAVVSAVGCNTTCNTDHSSIMACMRSTDWPSLKSASASIRPAPSTSVLRSVPPFYPQVDNELIFPDYLSLTRAGKFARIPLLASTAHNEAGWYRISAYGNGVVPTKEQVDAFHLESFTCPASYQAAARREYGVPAWVYRYFGDWENTRLYEGSGAYHGVDLHMVFGGSEEVSGLGTTEAQRGLTGLVQRAWAAFADDPWGGLERELGWPRWEGERESLVLLGVNNTAEARFVKPGVYDAACSTVIMGALGTPSATGVGSSASTASPTPTGA
jgi:carboxylesterase type B